MLGDLDYTDCTVIVRNVETKEMLVQTQILECNRKQHSIFIKSNYLMDTHTEKISLLILGEDFIHEYFGMARKTSNSSRVEISLFKGKEKEDRTAKRYELNAEAKISDVEFAEAPLAEENIRNSNEPSAPAVVPPAGIVGEKKVKLLNLSSIGVLIETEAGLLGIDATFKLKLDIAGKETVILCKTVRIESAEDKKVDCGCKFISVGAK